jgi:hypothetical protein
VAAQEYVEAELAKYTEQQRASLPIEILKEKQELVKECLQNFEDNFYGDLSRALTDPEHQVEVQMEAPFRKGVLLGVADIMLPGICADWKTGARIPSAFNLFSETQHAIYWHLAQQCGTPFDEFVYVYLIGKNVNMMRTKTGKVQANPNDRKLQFSFPVNPTKESVDSLMRNYVNPLAKQYENGVLYKVENDQNCGGCRYRTACHFSEYRDLPEIVETI